MVDATGADGLGGAQDIELDLDGVDEAVLERERVVVSAVDQTGVDQMGVE